jgi:hypothetical protein
MVVEEPGGKYVTMRWTHGGYRRVGFAEGWDPGHQRACAATARAEDPKPRVHREQHLAHRGAYVTGGGEASGAAAQPGGISPVRRGSEASHTRS